MPRLAPLLFIGLSLILAACGSDSDPVAPLTPTSINGRWVGEIIAGGETLPVEMELAEVSTEVGGQGTIRTVQDTTLTYTIRGSYVHPFVTLNLLFDQPPLGTLSGNVDEDRDFIDGTMAGPGFAGEVELTLRRAQAPNAAP